MNAKNSFLANLDQNQVGAIKYMSKNRIECDCCAYGKYVKPYHIDEVTWNLCKNCALLPIEQIKIKYMKKYLAKLGVRTRTNTILTDYRDYPAYPWMKDVYIKKIGA